MRQLFYGRYSLLRIYLNKWTAFTNNCSFILNSILWLLAIANGAAPKDVQELLGHSDVSTTMNVYAHSTRKDKRESARLLDKVAGND